MRRMAVLGVAFVVAAACSLTKPPEGEQALNEVTLPPGAVVLAQRADGIGATAALAVPEELIAESISFPAGSQPTEPIPPGPCDDGLVPASEGCESRYVVGARFPNPADPDRRCFASVHQRSDSVEVEGRTMRRAFVVTGCPEG
jgi:hypothetical protein